MISKASSKLVFEIQPVSNATFEKPKGKSKRQVQSLMFRNLLQSPREEGRNRILKKKMKILQTKLKKKQMQVSKQLGHESHLIPNYQLLPTQIEEPQMVVTNQAILQNTNEAAGVGTVARAARQVNADERKPFFHGKRTKLANVYPRRSYKKSIYLLMNCF